MNKIVAYLVKGSRSQMCRQRRDLKPWQRQGNCGLAVVL